MVGKGILITVRLYSQNKLSSKLHNQAKGYPDMQSRRFLRILSLIRPKIPIFVLVDFDPDGFGIMSTYKHGSMALAHESANLAVPSVQWLGVRSSDIMYSKGSGPGLMKLTARDQRIGMRMLERHTFHENGENAEWRRELQVMLMLHVKAEIQSLGSGEKLNDWVDEKLMGAIS